MNAVAALSERYVSALAALSERYVGASIALRERAHHCLSAVTEIQSIAEHNNTRAYFLFKLSV